MRLTCDVIVLSSTTMLASRISASRSFTWPGKRASACTIQNSVSVRSTAAAVPVRGQAQHVELERTALEDVFAGRRRSGEFAAAEQRGDARRQMRQARVLGQVVVGAQAQSGDDVEVAVARRQEDDRQRRRHRAQFPRQREAAVDVVAQADVDERQVGQPRAERGERVGAIGVRRDFVAVPAQRLRVVGADRGFVLDDRDAPHRRATIAQRPNARRIGAGRHLPPVCHFSSPDCPFVRPPAPHCAREMGLEGGAKPADATFEADAPIRRRLNLRSGSASCRTSNGLSANGVLRREWRQLGRLALESLATGVFVSLVLALAVFIVSFEARRRPRRRHRARGRCCCATRRAPTAAARSLCPPTCTWT